jgi:predicted nucleotidyltransferase
VRWIDPERIAQAVQGWAEAQRARHPKVSRIFWYGSWVCGRPTPASDVDLCVVVTDDHRRARDRIPDFLPDAFPAGVDLLVLTEKELQDLSVRNPGWYEAITSGRQVA